MTDDRHDDAPTAPHVATNAPEAAQHLGSALDALLAALVALGGIPAEGLPLPGESLDEALRRDTGYREARAEFRVALEALLGAVPEGQQGLVLRLEAAANRVAVMTAEVGWRLGLVVATSAESKLQGPVLGQDG